MTLLDAVERRTYTVRDVQTNDTEVDAFLFTLGCYANAPVTVLKRRRSGLIVSIKDGRYSIDAALAACIHLAEP